ncbi:MAG: hypothetical protein NZO16_07290, partial [Deltaproteobacteria bacterium]|nr:hypothetical protein [Deltaproteobacteria bacterium]
ISFRFNIDLNTVSDLLLMSIIPELDSVDLKNILEFRKSVEGPFSQFRGDDQLGNLVSNPDIVAKIRDKMVTENTSFEIYAKYECGGGVFMSRAVIDVARLGGSAKINRANSFEVYAN